MLMMPAASSSNSCWPHIVCEDSAILSMLVLQLDKPLLRRLNAGTVSLRIFTSGWQDLAPPTPVAIA